MHTQDRKKQLLVMSLQTLQRYIDFVVELCKDDKDTSRAAMYAQDIVYNYAAIQQFEQDGDERQLLDALVMQDTFVREYFADVIIAIEPSMACN